MCNKERLGTGKRVEVPARDERPYKGTFRVLERVRKGYEEDGGIV